MTKSRGIRVHHGLSGTPIAGVYNGMVMRCRNPKHPQYADYGGRGIAICPEWSDVSKFLADMGHPPAGATIERIDNDKGYSLENCRWATRTEQGRNKRNNIIVEMDGESLPLSAWVERGTISYATVHQRLLKGWSPEKALKTPLVKHRKGIPRGQIISDFQP